MSSIALRPVQRQQAALSPRLQHAVRLLQMSSQEFAHELQGALERNPFLESEDADGEPVPAATVDGAEAIDFSPLLTGAEPTASTDEPLSEAALASFELDERVQSEDRDFWQGDMPSQGERREGLSEAADFAAAGTSLVAHLHVQLDLLKLDPRERALAHAVAASLDDDGYLRMPLEDILDEGAIDPMPRLDELRAALAWVQTLEPVGVGACTVAECLHLQLAALDPGAERDLALAVVIDHLDRLAARDVSGLARALHRSVAEVESACRLIRRLDPHPGWRFDAGPTPYVTPDVVVRRGRGGWVAALNGSILPRLRLNHLYAELFQRNRSAQHQDLATHLQEARWTLRNIEQRFSTILSVAQAIVKRQRRFFEHGPLAMKPLCLQEIAEEVGIHESTVSRVTRNKYMATPNGIFELKYFFSRSLGTVSGGVCSATAIRGLIEELIAAESPRAPISDATIARDLGRQGLVVARRTVTKYRQQLRIDAVERRRQHA